MATYFITLDLGTKILKDGIKFQLLLSRQKGQGK